MSKLTIISDKEMVKLLLFTDIAGSQRQCARRIGVSTGSALGRGHKPELREFVPICAGAESVQIIHIRIP